MCALRVAVIVAVLCALASPLCAKEFDWRRGKQSSDTKGLQLVQFIKRTMEPGSWSDDKSITFRGGFLAVTHYEHVQRRIQILLDALRAASPARQ